MQRRVTLILFLWSVFLALASVATLGGKAVVHATPLKPHTAVLDWAVYFSPAGQCEEKTVAAINAAQESVHVQCYNYTNKAIADALIQAHDREVLVEVVADRSVPTERGSQLQATSNAGIHVWVDAKHAIAHVKLIVVDEEVCCFGSFNLTESAQHNNAELQYIRRDKELAKHLLVNYQVHKKHSTLWKP